jgi:thioredoxin-like negative regulator of GroEL
MGLLLSLLFCTAQAAVPAVPDYEFSVSLDPASKVPRWILEFTPPSGNHFNLGAPMKATAHTGSPDGAISFIRTESKKQRVRFASSDLKLKEGEEIDSSLFLCDEAKTYCIKKIRKFPLRVTAPSEAKKKPDSAQSLKDRDGFFVNQPEVALRAAVRAKKPLLIDFYGIWCPPCNLYNENVFPSTEFRRASREFVLLKVDADDERFFKWKAHFKVGGYPTIVLTQVPSSESLISLVEVDRIVGYFGPKVFSKKMKEAMARGGRSPEERLRQSESELIAEYRRLIPVRLEQKDEAGAIALIRKGLALLPSDPELRLRELALHKPSADLPVREALLNEVLGRADSLPDSTLMVALDLALDLPEGKSFETRKAALSAVQVLEKRLDPATLMLRELELSLADLMDFKKSLLEGTGESEAVKTARVQAIQAYRELLKLGRDPDSRGIHLELAALLWKNGQIAEAKSIYAKFIKKFPEEFTFHHAAAGMHLELKELREARTEAELAVRFAYGDNLIRSMERLTKIMAAAGERDFAISRARSFLDKVKVEEVPGVRTARYVASFKKTLDAIEKGSQK